MRQLLSLTVLLLGATWAAAQSYPSQTSPSTSSTSSASSNQDTSSSQTSSNPQSATGDTGSQTTVVGCLNGSSGSYTLTSSNGKTYQLTGDTAQLQDHVGHKVQIKGSVSPSSASSSGTGSSASSKPSDTASSNQATLSVSSMKHISKTCNSNQSSSSH